MASLCRQVRPRKELDRVHRSGRTTSGLRAPGRRWRIAVALWGVVLLVAGLYAARTPEPLSPAEEARIRNAVSSAGYPEPDQVGFPGSNLVVTITIDHVPMYLPSHLVVDADNLSGVAATIARAVPMHERLAVPGPERALN